MTIIEGQLFLLLLSSNEMQKNKKRKIKRKREIYIETIQWNFKLIYKKKNKTLIFQVDYTEYIIMRILIN